MSTPAIKAGRGECSSEHALITFTLHCHWERDLFADIFNIKSNDTIGGRIEEKRQ